MDVLTIQTLSLSSSADVSVSSQSHHHGHVKKMCLDHILMSHNSSITFSCVVITVQSLLNRLLSAFMSFETRIIYLIFMLAKVDVHFYEHRRLYRG